jgi:hypothetical protein
MVDVTFNPDLCNYTRKQRNVLFTFLDAKDEFELKQSLTSGYKTTDKYRTHHWAPNDIGLHRCCGLEDEDTCLSGNCSHFAAAILCDEYNCVNEYYQNKVGSLPMNPNDIVEAFTTEHAGTGVRTRYPISKNTTMGHYTGDIIPNAMHNRRQDLLEQTSPREYAQSYYFTTRTMSSTPAGTVTFFDI